ncbi:MAG TPA: hypothetical protein VKM72_14655 [Thermoanaerobaculia bacterium]|nr:hypothetical protein [Thermoanaerobaculia bacterium]
MSLQGFQQALTDLVMSPALRARVAEDPSACLAGYDLSDLERRRLEALARDPRVRTPTLLHRSFRLSMIANTLPRSCKALGPRGLRELTHAYWGEGPPRTMQFVKEALRFGGYALGRLRDGSFQHDFLEELLETEMAALTLDRSGAAWEAGERAVPDDLAFRTPRLHPACRVIPWRHDPDAVLAALDAGRPLEGFEEGEHCLLLAAAGAGKLITKTFGTAERRALLAADGTRTVGDLCAELDLPGRVFAELVAAGWLV